MNFKTQLSKVKNIIINNYDNLSETIKNASVVVQSPKPLNLISLGMSLIKLKDGVLSYIDANDYAKDNGFSKLEIAGYLTKYIFENLNIHKKVNIKIVEDYSNCFLYENILLFNVPKNPHDGSEYYTCYVKNGFEEDGQKIIKTIISSNITKNFIEVSLKKDRSLKINQFDLNFEKMQSKHAIDLHLELDQFFKKGYNRHILLNGLAGSGKSSLCRSVADLFNFKTLIIDPSIVNDLDLLSFFDLFSFLNIDCIILDDIDKILNEEQILSFLEEIKMRVKLIFSTSNEKKLLSSCVIRAGRVDKIIELNSLSEEIVRNFLPNEKEEIFQKIKQYPIAFINEYKIRKDVMGEEKAIASLQDLEDRIGQNRINKKTSFELEDKDDD